MFALSEQEKLNAYYEHYNNLKYNFAKKRRELSISQDMTSILSGVSRSTIHKIENSISESQDIKLSSLIDVCLLFGISISDLFEMRPTIDSEETSAIALLLAKPHVSPAELPEDLQSDFANYIGAEKSVSRDVFAAWHRIYSLKNHGEPKEFLVATVKIKIENLKAGESWNYKTRYHKAMYDLTKKMNDKVFKLRNVEPELNTCTRIK